MKPIKDPTLLKPGDPLISRDGEHFTFLAYVPEASPGEQLVILSLKTKGIQTRYATGLFYNVKGFECGSDVGWPSEKRTIWVNVYKNLGNVYGRAYGDEETANDVVGADDRLGGKAWPLEIEI